MSSYAEKLKDPRWQKKRLRILDRDGFKCRDCGSEMKTLHVHHCHYDGDPWRTNDDLLLTVCADCHEVRGEFEADGKRAVAYIFAKLGAGPNNVGLQTFVNDLVKAASSTPEFPAIFDYNEVIELKRRDAVQNKKRRR